MRLAEHYGRFSGLGACRLSRSAMRVCQPGPEALQRSRVSGGRRSVVTALGGSLPGPRRLGLSISATNGGGKIFGSTSDAGRARLKSAALSSRTSPSSLIRGLSVERFFMSFSLSCIGLPEADYPDAAGYWGEAQHVQSMIQISHGHQSKFWVRVSSVLQHNGRFEIEIRSPLERQATFGNVGVVLGGVEFDFHEQIVLTVNLGVKQIVNTVSACVAQLGRAGS